MKLSMIQHYKGATEFLFKQHPKAIFKALWLPLVLVAASVLFRDFVLISFLLSVTAYALTIRGIIEFMDTGTFSYAPWQWGKRDFSFLLRYSIFLLPSLLIAVIIGFAAGIVIGFMGYGGEFLINPTPLVTLLLGGMLFLVACFFMMPFMCPFHVYWFSAYHKPLKLKEARRLAKGNNLRFGFALLLYYTAIIILTLNPSFGGKVMSVVMIPLLTIHMVTFCVSIFLSLVKGKDYYGK